MARLKPSAFAYTPEAAAQLSGPYTCQECGGVAAFDRALNSRVVFCPYCGSAAKGARACDVPEEPMEVLREAVRTLAEGPTPMAAYRPQEVAGHPLPMYQIEAWNPEDGGSMVIGSALFERDAWAAALALLSRKATAARLAGKAGAYGD